jgi:dTDP-6-deoxy-L-talose 4-dehydrogenase (NAD+)
MTIAVTGATGFIGRHVIRQLVSRSVQTTILVRDPAQLQDLGRTLSSAVFDLQEPPADAYRRLGEPRTLIHLAWGGLPNYKSLHHFETELPSHYAFIKGMVLSGVERVVVAGTCLEYGLREGRLSEDMEACPTTSYGLAKDTLRRQLEMLAAERSFALVWARLFYVYGEGQKKTSLLGQLEAAVSRGDSRFDMSGGEQLRDFMDASEAAPIIVRLASAAGETGIVNVCSGEPESVRRFVERRIQEIGSSIELNPGAYPYNDYEPMAFWGCREKLDRCLGQG